MLMRRTVDLISQMLLEVIRMHLDDAHFDPEAILIEIDSVNFNIQNKWTKYKDEYQIDIH